MNEFLCKGHVIVEVVKVNYQLTASGVMYHNNFLYEIEMKKTCLYGKYFHPIQHKTCLPQFQSELKPLYK